MVEDLQHSDAGLNLLEALTSGTAIACSDGSYYLGISTSAFTLQGSIDEGRIDAVNQIPGDRDDQTSYRAELGGICGIISVLEALLLAYPHIRTLRLSIIISLDNASAINNVEKWLSDRGMYLKKKSAKSVWKGETISYLEMKRMQSLPDVMRS